MCLCVCFEHVSWNAFPRMVVGMALRLSCREPFSCLSCDFRYFRVCDGSFYHRLNLLSNLHCSFFRVTFQTSFSRKVVVVCKAVIIRRRKQSEPKLTEIPNYGWRIPESSKFHRFTFEVMFRDAGTSLRNSLRPIWAISSKSRRVWGTTSIFVLYTTISR